jgi:hypothetical protein
MATKVRHIRVPDDVWEAAQARAWAEHTTASTVAVEALREFGRSGARVTASGPPGALQALRSPVARPESGQRAEPVYAGEESGPPCRHPSDRVEDNMCRECGEDVWLP